VNRALNWDSILGASFALAGLALVLIARAFPPGLGGVPGPAFFPMLVGAVMLVLGVGLATAGVRHPRSYWDKGWRDVAVVRIVLILVLLAAYLATWDVIPFLPRTAVLLFAMYRALGESWLRAALLSIAITAVIYGTFQGLLQVRL